MNDPARRLTLRTGYGLLAVSLPLGLTLEALHGFKVRAFVQSEMRSELFRLAHAHGTLLGILCLVFVALAERNVPEASRFSIARFIASSKCFFPHSLLPHACQVSGCLAPYGFTGVTAPNPCFTT